MLQNHWNASEFQIVVKLRAASFFKESTLAGIRKLNPLFALSFWAQGLYIANHYWTVWEDEEEGEAQQIGVPWGKQMVPAVQHGGVEKT